MSRIEPLRGFAALLARRASRKRVAERPTSPGAITFEVGGVPYRVALKRVATAKRFTLRVRSTGGGVVLTLPPHATMNAAQSFVLRHADWIAERTANVKPRAIFEAGGTVPLRGLLHTIDHRSGLRQRVWIEEASGPRLCVSGAAATVDALVLAFLKHEARRDLVAAVERHAATVDRTVRGLTLRDTRSRWGSCTGRGTLNFSWRLIMAPPFVLDYLAAHEVAHLVHMNHAPEFWAVVCRLAPRRHDAEAWLKQHGPDLHRYGG